MIRRRITGEATARRSGGGPKPKLALHDDALRERIAAEPDITLAELQAWLLAERKVKVSVGCLWNRLNFLSRSPKKSERAAEQDRPDVAQARNEWRASQGQLNPERLVSSTRPAPQPTWRAAMAAARAVSAWYPVCRGDTGRQQHCRRAAGRADCCALCFQWTDGWPSFRAYVGQFVVPIPRWGGYRRDGQSSQPQSRGIREAIGAAGAELRQPPAVRAETLQPHPTSPS